MPKKSYIVILISAAFILFLITSEREALSLWMSKQWLDIIYAILLSIIVLFVVHYLYHKYYNESKFTKNTIAVPQKMLAKLLLNENNYIKISEDVCILGREDFVGEVLTDKLFLIGRKHFKLTKKSDGFYIEDLNSKNGTIVNNNIIKSQEKVKLYDNDKINVANTVEIIFKEDYS